MPGSGKTHDVRLLLTSRCVPGRSGHEHQPLAAPARSLGHVQGHGTGGSGGAGDRGAVCPSNSGPQLSASLFSQSNAHPQEFLTLKNRVPVGINVFYPRTALWSVRALKHKLYACLCVCVKLLRSVYALCLELWVPFSLLKAGFISTPMSYS